MVWIAHPTDHKCTAWLRKRHVFAGRGNGWDTRTRTYAKESRDHTTHERLPLHRQYAQHPSPSSFASAVPPWPVRHTDSTRQKDVPFLNSRESAHPTEREGGWTTNETQGSRRAKDGHWKGEENKTGDSVGDPGQHIGVHIRNTTDRPASTRIAFVPFTTWMGV